LAGTWLRHARTDRSPLATPADHADGRWQRGRVIGGFYLAESEDTVRAEWYRYLAEWGIPPLKADLRHLWRFDVDIEVADLSTAERLAEHGLALPTPDSLTWAPYQDVGEQLFREGWDGLVAPSAARPAGEVLCLFWRRPELGGVRAVPPPDRWEEPPVPPRGMTT
jgi:RES domain-containing protein